MAQCKGKRRGQEMSQHFDSSQPSPEDCPSPKERAIVEPSQKEIHKRMLERLLGVARTGIGVSCTSSRQATTVNAARTVLEELALDLIARPHMDPTGLNDCEALQDAAREELIHERQNQ
jgi:hypothetical protein